MSKGARERSLDSAQKALEAPGLGAVFVCVIRSLPILGMPHSHSGLVSLQRRCGQGMLTYPPRHTLSL